MQKTKTTKNQKPQQNLTKREMKKLTYNGSEYIAKATVFKGVFYYKSVIS